MQGRTVILVSHHVQLCTNGAAYVVALDNGRLTFEGPGASFIGSPVMASLIQSSNAPAAEKDEADDVVESLVEQQDGDSADGSDTAVQPSEPDAAAAAPPKERKSPRKFIEEEKRAVGRIGTAVWKWYIYACGGKGFWALFLASMIIAALVPVFENGWIRVWSSSVDRGTARSPSWYIGVYATVRSFQLVL